MYLPKFKQHIILVISCIFNLQMLAQQRFTSQDTIAYSTNLSGNYIYEQPDINSSRIALLDFGEAIALRDSFYIGQSIFYKGMVSHWLKVTVNERDGYILDTYLTRYDIRDKAFERNANFVSYLTTRFPYEELNYINVNCVSCRPQHNGACQKTQYIKKGIYELFSYTIRGQGVYELILDNETIESFFITCSALVRHCGIFNLEDASGSRCVFENETLTDVERGLRFIYKRDSASQYLTHLAIVPYPKVLAQTDFELRIKYVGKHKIKVLIRLNHQNRTNNEPIYDLVDYNVPEKTRYNVLSGIDIQWFKPKELDYYAGSRLDILRSATVLAGVSHSHDDRNDLIVRGNAPTSLAWQLEELPIENPNHLATIGTTGGSTSILHTLAVERMGLAKGNLAAQYGNGLAGVMDVSLRKGSSDKMGVLASIGSQRGELFWESGLGKSKKGASFMLSLRGSLSHFLFPRFRDSSENSSHFFRLANWAFPQYQDVNFKLHLGNYRWGSLELFGIAGNSSLLIPSDKVGFRDQLNYAIASGETFNLQAMMGVAGLKYTYEYKNTVLWRTIFGASYQANKAGWHQSLDGTLAHLQTHAIQNNYRTNYLAHSYVQVRMNGNLLFKMGGVLNLYDLSLWQQNQQKDRFDAHFKGRFMLNRAYLQLRWRVAENLVLLAGVHSQYSSLNRQLAIAPRASINWETRYAGTLALAYSQNQQLPDLQTLFYTPMLGRDSSQQPIYNYDGYKLPFMNNHQIDLEYSIYELPVVFKIACYAQFQNKIPIEQIPSAFSIMNINPNFFNNYHAPLYAGGKAINGGVDYSFEKYFDDHFYVVVSGSFFSSKYQGSDGIWRNTIFNTKRIFNVAVGGEWSIGRRGRNVLFTDMRFTTHRGRPYTPIDINKTLQDGYQESRIQEFYIDSLTNTARTRAFAQIDLKVGFKFFTDNKKSTHILRLDLYNAFNIKNIYTYRFSAIIDANTGRPTGGQIVPVYYNGFIPDLTYSIQF